MWGIWSWSSDQYKAKGSEIPINTSGEESSSSWTSGEAENFYGSRCLECSPEHGHLNKLALMVGMTQHCGLPFTKFDLIWSKIIMLKSYLHLHAHCNINYNNRDMEVN